MTAEIDSLVIPDIYPRAWSAKFAAMFAHAAQQMGEAGFDPGTLPVQRAILDGLAEAGFVPEPEPAAVPEPEPAAAEPEPVAAKADPVQRVRIELAFAEAQPVKVVSMPDRVRNQRVTRDANGQIVEVAGVEADA